jgi:hypothetical protein
MPCNRSELVVFRSALHIWGFSWECDLRWRFLLLVMTP